MSQPHLRQILNQLVSKPGTTQFRFASTGGRGNTKNVSRTNRNRRRGTKVADGDYVQRGTILTTQIHKFRFYPGSFVMVGRNMTLSAMQSGTVRITRELFVPKLGTELADAVKDMPMGSFLYKPTVNIIPDSGHGIFKLKEVI